MKKGIGFFGKLKNWSFLVSLVPLVILLVIVGIPIRIIARLAEANRDFAYWLWKKVEKAGDCAVIRQWLIRWDDWICENDAKQPKPKATERD